MKRKSKNIKRVLICLGVLVLFGISGIFGYSYFTLNQLKITKISSSDEELGITAQNTENKPNIQDQVTKERAKVTNLLLLGVDKEEDASDTIVVVSMDETYNKIRLTSIMRDSYIYFGKDKVNKINYAYHYGGPQLSIKTINQNYNLDIRDYVKVDFSGIGKIVDAMGGVTIQIKDYEVSEMKAYGINKAGTYNLNGRQALGYSRIRHVGNVDYERTQRQRTVLTELFKKAQSKGVVQLPSLISSILPYIETSLDKGELLNLGKQALSIGPSNMLQTRVPFDKYKSDATIDGRYYLKWDKEPTLNILHQFIYYDTMPK